MKKPREEAQILEELAGLASSPGFVHAVAQICYRDNFILIKGELKPADMDGLFSKGRLIRTELTTLIGLMVKKVMDLAEPSPEVIQGYIKRTGVLMEELHNAISYPMFATMLEAVKAGSPPPNPWHGPGMREPIFYGTESAYAFQYRDLTPEKYGADDEWILKNKGFTVCQARTIAKTMCNLMDKKGTLLVTKSHGAYKPPVTWLPAFEFSRDEVTLHSGVDKAAVDSFFHAFTFSGNNSAFKEASDFNEVAARPLIPTGRGTVLLFSHYAILEALYESPFFWMWDDKAYRPTAAKHRGAFTEQFAKRRLSTVFGSKHVHANVNLYRGKDVVGEADVLVTYGDRLIIVQAKAKKLTIASRKGNDLQLKADFTAAIQDSYDQGWSCATEMLAGGCRLVNEAGDEVTLPQNIKEVFLVSLVSEHYPALAFQVKQSLKFKATDVIRPPFVMDVFLLDTLAEMLASPLRLLSYVKLRVNVEDKLMSGHELTVLGYHLKQNLWLDKKHDLVMLDDSLARDLDAAMLVRRDSQLGGDTPAGILTKMRGTRYESLIKEIEDRSDPATLELGFHLLSMAEDTCRDVHTLLETITRKARVDGKRHDVTLVSSTDPSGITFHCNPKPSIEAVATLEEYCTKRKYAQRAPRWFGVSVGPEGDVQFGISLDFPWKASDEMARLTADMKAPVLVRDVLPRLVRDARQMKLGRNEPCHCGSNIKYKKCCMP
ncbi:SEC-C domain-containing protein [uncultured Comamonas sp.]|uniref:SEC-C domain-containing protein n=1 Tax=uncultured Comamonas sp. TaxID=114710 RepID=UPI003748FB50